MPRRKEKYHKFRGFSADERNLDGISNTLKNYLQLTEVELAILRFYQSITKRDPELLVEQIIEEIRDTLNRDPEIYRKTMPIGLTKDRFGEKLVRSFTYNEVVALLRSIITKYQEQIRLQQIAPAEKLLGGRPVHHMKTQEEPK